MIPPLFFRTAPRASGLLAAFVLLGQPAISRAAGDFVNFETPTVHPMDLSPDGSLLAVCQTADNRVLFFTLGAGAPVLTASVATGIDPVSVRFRTSTELWVVNQISDTVSIVDVAHCLVVKTLQTGDEPADVVFAGSPQRAFVSCSQENKLQVFDPASPATPPLEVPLEGEDPRALAVSPDGLTVYAAIFESGNSTTILAGGGDGSTITFPPNAVSDTRGPYGGTNPPPNSGATFNPPRNTAAGTPPKVGLIVKKNGAGRWFDDNARDWTALVSGNLASASGRPVGWDVVDNDVAIVNASSLSVTYARQMMNICMAIAVNPATGSVSIAGTEATNQIRFEPVLNGRFLRVQLGSFAAATPATTAVVDLNAHLTYATGNVAQAERDKSLGDPRALAWQANGQRGFVAGMGSNNVIVINPAGVRLAPTPIPVGQGPAGLVVDDTRQRLYVFNRFESSLSVIDLNTLTETSRTAFFDPTPAAIKNGRPLLFDTRRTSGLGHVSCASCHVDTRIDRLAWDLGDPAGAVKNVSASLHNMGGNIPGLTTNFTNFHPMKGPMTTQTLQDIIGKEPHHWRGDRNGIEEFNAAFVGLLGDDVQLTAGEMQQFEDYLATIYFPPNPYRNLDNTLPTTLPLPGHYTTGRFAPAGNALPPGNAQRALTSLYRPQARGIDQGTLACVSCHTLPTGIGMDRKLNLATQSFDPIAAGPLGERHSMLVSVDGSTQRAFKVPQTRNLYDKTGMDFTHSLSRSGFGFAHDGSVDSLSRFFSEGAFSPVDDQEIADLVALMLSFAGSNFGPPVDGLEPPGMASQDVPAAVGKQALLTSATTPAADLTRLNQLVTLANAGSIDLFAKSSVSNAPRGWHYLGGGQFQSDQQTVIESLASILARASGAAPVLFTASPAGTGRRMGIDRDRDGLLDFDETRDLAPGVAGVQNPFRQDSADSSGNNGSTQPDGLADGSNDFDGDGATNAAELAAGTNPADNLAAAAPLNLVLSYHNGAAQLTWTAEPHGQYEIRWTHDLMLWTPITTGLLLAGPSGGEMTWTDSGPPATPAAPADVRKRFYRVERIR